MFGKINLSKKMDTQALETLVFLLKTADQINTIAAKEFTKRGQSVTPVYLDDLIDKASRGASVTKDELELMKKQMTTVYSVFKEADDQTLKLTADAALMMFSQLSNL